MLKNTMQLKLISIITIIVLICTSCSNNTISINAELRNYDNSKSPNNKYHYYELFLNINVKNQKQYSSIDIEIPDLSKTSIKECIVGSSETSTDNTSQDFVAETINIQLDPTGLHKDDIIYTLKSSSIDITFTEHNGKTCKRSFIVGEYLKIKI